jgi:hypothetical protein
MGMEYSFLSRGQTIRAEYSDFYETLHMLNLCYSPFEFVRFTVGFGADKYKVVEEKKSVFNGNYGFSPGFKLNLFSPQIAGKVIRFTSQFEFLYINSYDQFDNNYKSILFNPGGGIIIHIGPHVDVETGGKAHYIKGWEKYRGKGGVNKFSNDYKMRGYLTLSLCSLTGSYFCFNMDMSPEVSSGSEKRINEAAIGFSIGTQFRAKSKKRIKMIY